ncbi:MAG: diaminopimelate epimerase [Rhodothermales bacterium]|nr:diaminopimelate epimerase [Rhodothermales bacterium]
MPVRPLVVEFTKMNGAGNDFVVLDNRFYAFSEDQLGRLAAWLCPRRTAVGADGLLALDPGDDDADFRMRYRNADGSRGTMCGNGARCLARFARSAGFDRDRLVFDTDAGRYIADVPEAHAAPVRLHVPPPRNHRGLTVEGCDLRAIWTGTEHVVAFVDDVQAFPLATLGPAIRNAAALAPNGANVNAAEVLDDGRGCGSRLRVRTYEKGVEAETDACGTGAMAAALAARLTGRVVASPVAVEMPGGVLTVGFDVSEGNAAEAVRGLTLEGPAVVAFRGTVELDTRMFG